MLTHLVIGLARPTTLLWEDFLWIARDYLPKLFIGNLDRSMRVPLGQMKWRFIRCNGPAS